MTQRILFLATTDLLFTATAQAQWFGSLSLDNGYDDNMFRNYNASGSASTDVSLMFGYFPDEQNWAVNYSGSLSAFSEYPERFYSVNSLGASYVLSLDKAERNTLTFLASGTARIDREDYMLYDYSQAMASVSLKQYLGGSLPLMASYRARYRQYPNFGELSYLEHFATLGSMIFFETRTSIRAQVELGYKNYTSNFLMNDEPAGGSGFVADQTGLTLDGGGDGNGGGNGNTGGGNGSSGGGNGNTETGNGNGSGRMNLGGNGNGQAGMESSVDYLIYEEPSTSQLSAWINVGQSLGEQTGLSVRLRQRWNLTARGRAFVGGAIDFIGEEELFDDPYSYESTELSLMLTQMLPWSMTLKAGALYFLKNYEYPAIFDSPDTDTPMREDTRSGGWISLSRAFGGDWLLFSGLRISFNYTYLSNESNTEYYNYNSHAVGLGLSTEF